MYVQGFFFLPFSRTKYSMEMMGSFSEGEASFLGSWVSRVYVCMCVCVCVVEGEKERGG